MILKKPYGFYKRHYKTIHFLLLIPMLYLFFVFKDVHTFFNGYIKAGFETRETDLVDSYLPNLALYTIFFMIFIQSFIFWLEKSKKKSGLLHLISLIYYILVLVSLIFISGAMESVEAGSMTETYSIFIRDIASVIKIPPFILMGWTIIKGIGFNIKTLSFERNYDNLVSDEDDELVEVRLSKDSFESKRKIVHFLREAKYYVLENSFIFKTLCVVLSVFVVYKAYMYVRVYNRQYNVNQSFVLNNMSITLKDSYITDVDYSGNEIQDGYYYLAVKINLRNNTMDDIKIDKSNFRIFIGDDVIYPDYSRSGRFIDVGKEYLGNSIPGGFKNSDGTIEYTQNDYVLVYELTKDQIKTQYEMKILSNYGVSSNNKLLASYKNIKIKPKNILNKEIVDTVNINKEISLSETTLGKTKYQLLSYEIVDKYTISYESCSDYNKEKCTNMKKTVAPSSGKIFIIIKDKIIYDETSAYYQYSTQNFYNDFATLSFKVSSDDRTHETKLTKTTFDDKYSTTNDDGTTTRIYEIDEYAKNGTDKILKLNIRNKEIDIKLE